MSEIRKLTSRFHRDHFGGGETGERKAYEALLAHETKLRPGVRVRVYRGRQAGLVGTITGRHHRGYGLDTGDGLHWEVESRNLEVDDGSTPVVPPGTVLAR